MVNRWGKKKKKTSCNQRLQIQIPIESRNTAKMSKVGCQKCNQTFFHFSLAMAEANNVVQTCMMLEIIY